MGTTMQSQVKRTELLNLVREKADKIEAGTELPRFIINVHGIVGIGKTSLLEQVFDEFQHDYSVIYLNFDREDHKRHPERVGSWANVLNLLRTLAVPSFEYLPDHIVVAQEKRPASDVPLIFNGFPDTPEALKDRLKAGKPLLMLLDSLDELPYWKWIQEHIIKPLLDQQRTLFIITSQSRLGWHFWELREQTRTIELGPFTSQETKEFLTIHQKEQWTDYLYEVTEGYPLGLVHMVELLSQQRELEEQDPKYTNGHMKQQYHDEMIEELKKQLPSRVRQDLESFLRSMVVLSEETDEFDLVSLRREINKDHHLNPGRVNNAITSLDSRGIVTYDRARKKYTLNPLVKKIM